jgi:dihydrofolate reductase
MSARCRIEGYAIVSVDGMIADASGVVPDSLKSEADQRYFERALERVDLVVHGRRSHEGHPNSAERRRLVLTRRIAAIAPNPDDPRSALWNPAGAAFEAACAALGVAGGVAAIIGGPEVYGLFVEIGYDAFHLSRAGKVALPGGLPVFGSSRAGLSPEETLRRSGLEPEAERALDAANGVTLVDWRRRAPA